MNFHEINCCNTFFKSKSVFLKYIFTYLKYIYVKKSFNNFSKICVTMAR